jgi:hypothetical protein
MQRFCSMTCSQDPQRLRALTLCPPRPCVYCGRSFTPACPDTRYCSKSCIQNNRWKIAHALRIPSECLQCGKAFFSKSRSKQKPQRFCSQRCWGAWCSAAIAPPEPSIANPDELSLETALELWSELFGEDQDVDEEAPETLR